MTRTIIYYMMSWLIWVIGMSLYFEYIISRPVNGYLQFGLTITAFILTVGLLVKTVKAIINFKNKTNND